MCMSPNLRERRTGSMPHILPPRTDAPRNRPRPSPAASRPDCARRRPCAARRRWSASRTPSRRACACASPTTFHRTLYLYKDQRLSICTVTGPSRPSHVLRRRHPLPRFSSAPPPFACTAPRCPPSIDSAHCAPIFPAGLHAAARRPPAGATPTPIPTKPSAALHLLNPAQAPQGVLPTADSAPLAPFIPASSDAPARWRPVLRRVCMACSS